ncbi:MAG: VOC family protein [Myxococcota bacterium]
MPLHIDYVELPAVDMEASKAFYTAAFGWTFQDWAPDYAAFSGAGIEGGLTLVDSRPPKGGALVILYTDDLSSAQEAVIEAGGRVTERLTFPGGQRFHFTDPSGLELAVWTNT